MIDGAVYDVTAYLKHHPGSEEQLLLCAGRDANKAFQFAHSAQAAVQAMLENRRIGRVAEESEGRAGAALRTLNSVSLLSRIATSEAIVRDDDFSFRPWRARIVTTSWLGHIKDGVLPLVGAALDAEPAGAVAEALDAARDNSEAALNDVLRLSRSQNYDGAYQALQAFTAPIPAWLQEAATAPSDDRCSTKAMLKHITEFRVAASK